jgi:5-methylcytosine-specific restriction endonuclease McrA
MTDIVKMRASCRFDCGSADGYITTVNGQDTVRCRTCNRFQYNAPRVETGRAPRTVTTVHNGIKPAQRARVLERDGRCVLCGRRDDLHVGHLIPVARGLETGLTEVELNDDENLAAMCDECNLGLGARPLALWVVAPILRLRLRGSR